ncbi:NAD(P)-dependent oxidoreductase [Methylobacterium frigidaeris]|uniref:Hydroxypyruvate reductase n=1 Tax=Methylobacterium frigidaeris TaxID=2038277 RepID=A0AA37M3H8_9HYPH|nr:NAD(P)-dependent oxidoreductase [Methylobacterium frigidaeris]PIK68562.1 hydroxyacid dehydrogenase [Methylobacterium frigidaeris]GJD61195.1 Hydroxypyruvate reductase [Methylobacterium frigidaeris]
MKLLLTHTPQARAQYYGAEALDALQGVAGVRLHQGDAPLDADALVAAAADVDLIVADRATAVPAAVFERLPGLRAVLRVAVDIRTIDVPAASAAGVLVTRARPGFVAAVSELALGMMIDLSRGLSRSVLAYRAGAAPEVRMGRQLAGSTAGIIGYGAIGRRLGALLAALGMEVLVSDPYARVTEPGLAQVDLPDLLARSDYVVCLAVASAETRDLIDAAALARCKPGAYLLNLSRGSLVDEGALAAALRDGRLAGAALDVGRAPDEMPSPDLAALPQVVATPHVGGLTPPAVAAQALETVEQVRTLLAGRVPEGAVNAESWTRRPG